LPGEYRVNYHDATDATARMAETIDQALWPEAREAAPRRAGLDGKDFLQL